MTTTVKILACCTPDKVVEVTISSGADITAERFYLNSGEAAERVIYNDRSLFTREVARANITQQWNLLDEKSAVDCL